VNVSKSSVELVYEILGAHQQGDEERLRSLMHPGAEVHGAPGLINAGTYYGVYPDVEEALEAARRIGAERV
jgi:hypothetical protein